MPNPGFAQSKCPHPAVDTGPSEMPPPVPQPRLEAAASGCATVDFLKTSPCSCLHIYLGTGGSQPPSQAPGHTSRVRQAQPTSDRKPSL